MHESQPTATKTRHIHETDKGPGATTDPRVDDSLKPDAHRSDDVTPRNGDLWARTQNAASQASERVPISAAGVLRTAQERVRNSDAIKVGAVTAAVIAAAGAGISGRAIARRRTRHRRSPAARLRSSVRPVMSLVPPVIGGVATAAAAIAVTRAVHGARGGNAPAVGGLHTGF